MIRFRESWSNIVIAAAWLVTMATFLGLPGNRPYIAIIAIHVAFVAFLPQARSKFPTFPEAAIILGWMFLAVSAVFWLYVWLIA